MTRHFTYDTIESSMKYLFFILGLLLFLGYLLHPPLTYAIGDCTGTFSFCSLQSLPSGAQPGTTCADGGGNYVYGTSGNCGPGQSGTCIPRCGSGNGFCCDPKPGYAPKGALPDCAKVDVNGACTAVDTAIGTISTQPAGVAGSIMGILLSLSGGIAIILIMGAGYQMVMSQGNPEKVKEARERLTSAIVGLLFIIFSVVILQIIGIDILHIPGLNP